MDSSPNGLKNLANDQGRPEFQMRLKIDSLVRAASIKVTVIEKGPVLQSTFKFGVPGPGDHSEARTASPTNSFGMVSGWV